MRRPISAPPNQHGNRLGLRFAQAKMAAKIEDLQPVHAFPPSARLAALGGKVRLDVLYVTSARFTQSAEHLAAHPWEGGLFALEGVGPGRPPHRFGQAISAMGISAPA